MCTYSPEALRWTYAVLIGISVCGWFMITLRSSYLVDLEATLYKSMHDPCKEKESENVEKLPDTPICCPSNDSNDTPNTVLVLQQSAYSPDNEFPIELSSSQHEFSFRPTKLDFNEEARETSEVNFNSGFRCDPKTISTSNNSITDDQPFHTNQPSIIIKATPSFPPLDTDDVSISYSSEDIESVEECDPNISTSNYNITDYQALHTSQPSIIIKAAHTVPPLDTHGVSISYSSEDIESTEEHNNKVELTNN